MKWLILQAMPSKNGRGFKRHLCPKEFVEPLKQNLISRGARDEDFFIKEIERYHIDFGGVVWSERYLEEVVISELVLTIPAEEYQFVLEHILESEVPRKEIGIPYFKIHIGETCLCLTPEIRRELITIMEKDLHRMMKIANAEAKMIEDMTMKREVLN